MLLKETPLETETPDGEHHSYYHGLGRAKTCIDLECKITVKAVVEILWLIQSVIGKE